MIELLRYAGGTTTVEYVPASENMVIFSHGFGVFRDDRGMLSDIAAALPYGYGHILFDYYDADLDRKTVQIKSWMDQQDRLRAVARWARERFPNAKLHIIGHSLGCTVVTQARPGMITGKVFFLAPPLQVNQQFRELFTGSPQAKNKMGIWHLPRRDGTVTLVPETYFKELLNTDAENLLKNYAQAHPFCLVLPSYDQLFPDADYTEVMTTQGVSAAMVDNSDHSFSDPLARSDLTKFIVQQLQA